MSWIRHQRDAAKRARPPHSRRLRPRALAAAEEAGEAVVVAYRGLVRVVFHLDWVAFAEARVMRRRWRAVFRAAGSGRRRSLCV